MPQSSLAARSRVGHTRRVTLWLGAVLVAVLPTACIDGAPGSATSPERSAAREIPLTVVERGGQTIVLAPVSIHGEGPYTFVLDTGASSSVVDDDLARELDLPRTGKRQPISGVIGEDTVPVVSVREWKVGDISLDATDTTVVDLDSLHGDRPIEGLLGSDVLSDFGQITVDYEKETLRLPAA
ncbi:aspartyl protease family protein [Streptomyces sp. NPDC002845]